MVKLNCSKIAKFVFISLITPLFVVAYFSSQKAQAQMPSTINFQGKIVRNDSGYEGMNVTTGSPACVQAGADTCDFQVKYYSASSGGTLFLTETFVDKEIGQYGGVFELSLGSGSITAGSHSTLDEVIQKENTVYIEIGFSPAGNSTFTETFTRMYLQANAFAIRSKYSEMAKGAFKFENAPNSSGYSGSDGMVYYDTTTGGLKLYSAGVWLDISTGTSSSLWGTDSISSYSHNPSQFLETSGIATLSNFGLDTTVNRAWIHGASSRTGFSVYSNYGGATDWPLVTFKADASNFGNSILQLIQDGTGSILEGYKGTNKVFDIDNRGDMHLSSDGILYFEPFSSLPSSGNLFPGSGEGCLYSAGGNIYWDSGCDASSPTMLNAISSSLWTDAGSFTYLTSTGDNLVLGGNSVATATFFFDMTGASGRYFRVDNYNNTETLFTIDSSGNVGIGTAAPGAKLDIGGSSANISNAIGDITIIPAQNLIISQGNVGIGNSSPTSLLSVGSSSQFQVDTNGDLVKIKNLTYSWPTAHATSGLLSNNGSGTLTWNTPADLGLSNGTGVAGQITFWSGTSTITGDNNLWWDNVNKRLGIGTTTPQATIDIAGASSEIANTSGNITIAPAENLIVSQGKFAVGTFGTGNTAPASKFHMRWANSGAGGGMDVGGQLMNDAAIFENSGNTHLQLMTGGSGFFSSINFSIPTNAAHGSIKYNYTAGPGGVANGFGFWTNGNVFRMALDQNGNLGVGIASPAYKLDINGDTRGLRIMSKSTGNFGSVSLMSGNASLPGYIEWRLPSEDGALGTRLGYMGWNATNINLYLENSANFVVSGGKVGIGTNNPRRQLSVGDGLDIYSSGSSTTVPSIRSNADTSNLIINAANNGTVYLNYDSGTGGVAFNNGTSTIVARMTGAGNLGLGTSSPGYRLDIVGSTRISAGSAIISGYNNRSILQDHNNGNITLNAAGGNLYVGYTNSNIVEIRTGGTSRLTVTSNGSLIHHNATAAYNFVTSYSGVSGGSGYSSYIISAAGANVNYPSAKLIIDTPYYSSSSGSAYMMSIAGTPASQIAINPYGLFIDNMINAADTSGLVYLRFSSSYTQRFRFRGDGTGYADASWTTFSPYLSYNYIDSSKTKADYQLGDVVKLDTSQRWIVNQTDKVADNQLYGVIVRPEGFVSIPKELKNQLSEDRQIESFDVVPVAHLGEASTKVLIKPGQQINPGSYVTSSNVIGFAELASKPGNILGKALEGTNNWNSAKCSAVNNISSINWPEDDGSNPSKPCYKLPDGTFVGKIMVFVNVSWYDPSIVTEEKITTPGWYRVSQGSSSESGNVKISNNTLGSSQNINLMVDRNNISVLSNFTSGNYGITKARLNTSGNMTYLEVYIENTNNNSVSVKVEGWSSTGISKVDTLSTAKEYILSGIQFGVSDTFSVNKENLTTSGTLLTSGMFSDIGNSTNRWNDIFTKGTIRLGSGNSEGGIRYNVEKKRLEFSNDGINWVEMGDLTSNVVISPEYSGAILYADGSDNHGRMISDAINIGGVFKNYYEWKSDRETLQDYDILVRITLPSDFVSWKEDAISLDFMTENSASIANNKVEIALMGDSGIDSEIKNGISKMPGSWERISIKAVDITQCKKAGDSCTLRLSMYSKENYYVRVGDISLNYNRGL